ncbi:MAG: hypothetical protein EB012_13175, partial [Gammaproteobacteria bacterium]|nr:hypothetical protein [Gammaproteobacteria bacterium]NDE57737.1 hypothetical protein [Gammaproteobacteria bacterium]
QIKSAKSNMNDDGLTAIIKRENTAIKSRDRTHFLQKSQYRMSMVWPVPEITGNHAVGANTATWGLGHSYPGPGDEHVYLLWEWEDCCLPLF